MSINRGIKCDKFEPIASECQGCKDDYIALEEKTCSVCNNFRSNCHTKTCSECKDVQYDFYCAIDKHEI